MSPTISELKKYLSEKGGKMTFPDFLKVMHSHNKEENIPKEVVDAFKAADTQKTGYIPAKYLKHMLVNWGEYLSPKEVDQIFREANVTMNSKVRYEEFVKIACAPVPDYYWPSHAKISKQTHFDNLFPCAKLKREVLDNMTWTNTGDTHRLGLNKYSTTHKMNSIFLEST